MRGLNTDANARFINGDPLTNEEVSWLLEFYTEMSEHLRSLGPEFHLTWKEIYTRQRRLDEYTQSRGMKNVMQKLPF